MKTALKSKPCKRIGQFSLGIWVLIMISSCSFDATKRRYNNGWNLNFSHKNVGLDLPKNKTVQQEKSIKPLPQGSLFNHQPMGENSLTILPPTKLIKISQPTLPYQQLNNNNTTLSIEKHTDIANDFNELTQEELNASENRHNQRYLNTFYKFIISIVGIITGIISLIIAEILWLDSMFLFGGLLVFFSIIFTLAFLFSLATINKEDPIYERYLRRYLQLGLASVFLLGLFLSPLFFILGYRSKDKFIDNKQRNSFGSNHDTSKIILTAGIVLFLLITLLVYGGFFFFLF